MDPDPDYIGSGTGPLAQHNSLGRLESPQQK